MKTFWNRNCFGYEEGAFSGAKKGGKIGHFELAHKGTNIFG
ncbi:MAG: sigma 54-interacting transcriptional regulator [Tepidanaerobacteraceae bacterium]